MPRLLAVLLFVSVLPCARADWRVYSTGDTRQSHPPAHWENGTPIKPGDPWPNDAHFRWLIGELELPAAVDGHPTIGQVVGLRFNCGDGGELWLGDQLQARYDNDHPALVVISDEAQPNTNVRIVAQVYGKVQGEDRFGQADWVIIEPRRGRERLKLRIDARHSAGSVPAGIVGLSQGGGMSDYEPNTAKRLREAGFRWFRMDNVFTSVLKKGEKGEFIYDWADFDRRVDFIYALGADPILAVSYMPQVLDAVSNNDRQSAPRDYAQWERLCFEAAQRSQQRGKRVPFWEVWNEVNTGWLKPGPEDTGSRPFEELYTQALGHPESDREVIRRFEAYCKLYRATAKGVLRADPSAKIGGPALASGPMEHDKCGHCFHGRGFARGLMLWCAQEKLPLDFLSWHEYFQPPEVFTEEARTFRAQLADFPSLQAARPSLMITEWNQAWWADRPQDHEVGAAWCANTITRAFLPAGIERPCFFYAKQGDMNFRGDYSLLLPNNIPKPAYHVARLFNGLAGNWLAVTGSDEDISAVATWDANHRRLAVVLVNFRDRYALPRRVQLEIQALPEQIRQGQWREWTVDATHSNVWHDAAHAELEQTGSGSLDAEVFTRETTLQANSITLLELRESSRERHDR